MATQTLVWDSSELNNDDEFAALGKDDPRVDQVANNALGKVVGDAWRAIEEFKAKECQETFDAASVAIEVWQEARGPLIKKLEFKTDDKPADDFMDLELAAAANECQHTHDRYLAAVLRHADIRRQYVAKHGEPNAPDPTPQMANLERSETSPVVASCGVL